MPSLTNSWSTIERPSGTSALQRHDEEEQAPARKPWRLLNNSPYKTQLANATLFLSALQARQKEIPNLIAATLGR